MKKELTKAERERIDYLIKKWKPILDHIDNPKSDAEKLKTAYIIESQEKWCVDD